MAWAVLVVRDIFLASAAFGHGDVIKPMPEHDGIRAYMHTDQPVPERIAATWTSVTEPLEPRRDIPAKLRAYFFKHQIQRNDFVRQAQWLVWMDASIHLFETDFIREWCAKLNKEPGPRRCLFIPHQQRKMIGEEADFIREQIEARNPYVMRRYNIKATTAQMTRLLQYDDAAYTAPLYCGGFWIVENHPAYWQLLDAWWAEHMRFGDGAIDQLALGALLQRGGFEPNKLEVELFSNQHFAFVAHP